MLYLWGNACNTYLSSLHKLQKKVVRIITFNDHFTHSLPLFSSLKILTIYDIYKIELSKFVYDCLNKLNPIQFHDYFTFSTTTLNTAVSRSDKLKTPQVRTTTYGLKSIKYDGAVIWNNISLPIRSRTSSKIFKKQLKDIYIALYSTQ